ncbi:TVP38/TMEM64 family protein [Streptococcus pacificus]|uniref:TVP38/TMEM64 family membrane protein n=1 Tax=Streptococcus pacificus TaxID=2740577 RepID=A0ABS0ZJG3_9STRE|nr:TVP38/TMEM64 family protein [Streptococcus pacificus]MBJ8326140.1 TVP38/TMEM64 family protein [Streptococcus pacificus]
MNTKHYPTISNKQLIQIMTLLGIGLSVLLAIYIKTNPHLFSVNGSFTRFLKDIGFWGPIGFILIQIIQVIYPVIPGGLTCVIGHALFGPLYGFLYNVTGIFIGSVLAFLLARRYGEHFVKAFVSDETYDKYITYLDKGHYFDYFLATAFILPGFPDDFLCMVAGLSKMSLKKFTFITLLSKPATLYLYTYIAFEGIQLIDKVVF